jgi:hypothetical protein
MNFYAHEKIQELESELKSTLHFDPPAPPRWPVFGGLAAGVGHLLRHAGEGLEAWSGHATSESENTLSRHSAR